MDPRKKWIGVVHPNRVRPISVAPESWSPLPGRLRRLHCRDGPPGSVIAQQADPSDAAEALSPGSRPAPRPGDLSSGRRGLAHTAIEQFEAMESQRGLRGLGARRGPGRWLLAELFAARALKPWVAPRARTPSSSPCVRAGPSKEKSREPEWLAGFFDALEEKIAQTRFCATPGRPDGLRAHHSVLKEPNSFRCTSFSSDFPRFRDVFHSPRF